MTAQQQPMDPRQYGVPESAMGRLAQLRDGSPGAIFTSDLSVSEFLLVRQSGFRPLGLVMGSSIYHVGYQSSNYNQNQELGVLTQATYNARHLAMTRMQLEANQLGADGIVGVALTVAHGVTEHAAEFIAIGTAIKADKPAPGPQQSWKDNQNRPFTSALSGQEFWTLLQSGYVPCGLVLGSCVYHIAHRSLRQTLSQMGQNTELTQFTQALYEARELAMDRMQREAEVLGSEGVLNMALTEHGYGWAGHAIEYLAVGTAVRPLRPDHQITSPQLTLGLD